MAEPWPRVFNKAHRGIKPLFSRTTKRTRRRIKSILEEGGGLAPSKIFRTDTSALSLIIIYEPLPFPLSRPADDQACAVKSGFLATVPQVRTSGSRSPFHHIHLSI